MAVNGIKRMNSDVLGSKWNYFSFGEQKNSATGCCTIKEAF